MTIGYACTQFASPWQDPIQERQLLYQLCLKFITTRGVKQIIIVVSPTFDNNAFYFKDLPIDEENDVVEPDEFTCQWIVDELQATADWYAGISMFIIIIIIIIMNTMAIMKKLNYGNF
jgi:hypothetical protein